MKVEIKTISQLNDFITTKSSDLQNRFIKEFGITFSGKYKRIVIKNDNVKKNHFAVYLNGSLYSLIPHIYLQSLKYEIYNHIYKYGWESCYFITK